MDGSYIPPPFPFPEAWPKVFASQILCQDSMWLTPPAFITSREWKVSMSADFSKTSDTADSISTAPSMQDKDDDDDDCDIAYVLSEEWQKHFQLSSRLQKLQKQTQKSGTKSKMRKQQQRQNNQHKLIKTKAAGACANRSSHLQREVQAAKLRDEERKWTRRSGESGDAPPGPQIARLEASLNARFDEFCDKFQPAMWPYDSLPC
ncbi:hypothetical protein CCR75_004490 [Bremia lactucae]|uniref:Uncharacterized protein n=1 Tax=Bremia lactucae TaxID=4779 RepID=A0A976IE13_BRELC|nr:hypothetical protein CCR75_004490 [Bremia lactucae]